MNSLIKGSIKSKTLQTAAGFILFAATMFVDPAVMLGLKNILGDYWAADLLMAQAVVQFTLRYLTSKSVAEKAGNV